jgi:undecaprenyl-diphosphatase
LIYQKRWSTLKTFLIVFGGTAVTTYGLKYLIGRPRPTDLVTGYSFVSAHSSFSLLTYGFLSLVVLARKYYVIIPTAILVGLIGVSRIVLKVHYPTDVIAGFMLGLIWLYVGILREKRLK